MAEKEPPHNGPPPPFGGPGGPGGPGGGPENLSKDGILAAVEEAKDAPILFKPRERAIYVRERVQELRRLRALGQNDIQIKAAMGDFVEKYPELFKMAVEPSFNQQQLNLMLGLLDKMADGGMSQHQASVIVGQSLADKYINPVVKNTPPDRIPPPEEPRSRRR